MSEPVRYTQNAPVLFGAGAVAGIGANLVQSGVKKALLIYDAGVKAAGIAEKVTKYITDAGIEALAYDTVPPDPPDTVVDEVAALAKAEAVDALVAIGGGSCLDTAKGANYVVTNDLPSVQPYIDGPPVILAPSKLQVILIPTTAGTGAEVTFVAVLSDTKNGLKGGVYSPGTLAIVDPELTLTVPPHITAMTGLDALAHAAESYTCVDRLGVMPGSGFNPHAAALDISAIKRVFKWLPVAYNDGSNLEARTEMAIAANFASIGFADTLVQLGHGVAEEVGAALHLPHGLCTALLLASCLEISAPAVPDRIKEILDAIEVSYPENATGEELGAIIADAVRGLAREVGLKSFKDLGYSLEDITDLTDRGLTNWILIMCPVDVTRDTVYKLLADSYNLYQ